MKKFEKSFTQQEAIDETGIKAAIQVMQSGRLHRYNRIAEEKTETDYLELEFSDYIGIKNVLACASCGYALAIALKAAGIKDGDKVLCNAFTLSPVPGAIHHSGGKAVLVEMDKSFCIDLDDLEEKAQKSNARFLMLSHMRGHIADMDRLMDIAQKYQLIVIEDCAHTMGAEWKGQKSGTFGDIACFSTQTYKHINSGEGGLLVTPHDDIMAKAIIYSGSYMFYQEHKAAPNIKAFNGLYEQIPNYSGRMDNLRAAILRPQLADMDNRRKKWNDRYQAIENILQQNPLFYLPKRSDKELYVGSSIQFRLPHFSSAEIKEMVKKCNEYGVILKWFGALQPQGYTSHYKDWCYMDDMPDLPQTNRLLATFLDMRIPLTFSIKDCKQVAEIIVYIAREISHG